jgi:C4-dicarboxylate-specific signal transduction histidine kinase
VLREFEPPPAVRVDRHKLMEILVNPLQNASQALARDAARAGG